MSVSDQEGLEPCKDDNVNKARCPFGVCVCVCARARISHRKLLGGEHQSVLPAAFVDLFGVSSCLEAPFGKGQAEVEEAATEALPGSLFLMVRASQFCVAPAGQSKLRSGAPSAPGPYHHRRLGVQKPGFWQLPWRPFVRSNVFEHFSTPQNRPCIWVVLPP